jgi:hypothetical protein
VGLGPAFFRCPNLTSLDLSSSFRVSDVVMAQLGTSCKKLTTLDLAYCEQLTDVGLRHLAAGCHQLTSLYLTDCSLVTDMGLLHIAAGCTVKPFNADDSMPTPICTLLLSFTARSQLCLVYIHEVACGLVACCPFAHRVCAHRMNGKCPLCDVFWHAP